MDSKNNVILRKDPLSITQFHMNGFNHTTINQRNDDCLYFYKKNKYFLMSKCVNTKAASFKSPCDPICVKLAGLLAQKYTGVKTEQKSVLKRIRRVKHSDTGPIRPIFKLPDVKKDKPIETIVNDKPFDQKYNKIYLRKRTVQTRLKIGSRLKDPNKTNDSPDSPDFRFDIEQISKMTSTKTPDRKSVV